MAVKTSLKTHIDLPAAERAKTVEALNVSLAAAFDLQSQTKQAHWNVKGKDFYQLHKLFDELAEEVETYVDAIAERITALGGTAFGTVRMAAEASILPEYPTEIMPGMEHVELLSQRYAAFGKHTREMIDKIGEQDQATTDLYTEITREIDQRLYFLEAHLQA